MTGRRSDDVGASPSSPLVGRLAAAAAVAAAGGWAATGRRLGAAWRMACGDARGTRDWEPRARWLRDAKDHYPLRDRKGVLVEISLRLNEL